MRKQELGKFLPSSSQHNFEKLHDTYYESTCIFLEIILVVYSRSTTGRTPPPLNVLIVLDFQLLVNWYNLLGIVVVKPTLSAPIIKTAKSSSPTLYAYRIMM
jgi:hypothetical protein